MAASFSDLSTIAQNSNFIGRVLYALMVAAINVYAEDPATAGHAARKEQAQRVFNGINLTAAAMLVLTNATIAAEANVATTPGFAIPDGDIQFAVNSLWNFMSGV